ncbi:group II intron maturase-specific domain-containing protein [Desulfobulbus propionicus]
MTRRNSGKNLEQVINEFNPVLRGFAFYFRIANCKAPYLQLSRWIRRRLRLSSSNSGRSRASCIGVCVSWDTREHLISFG